MTFLCRFLTCFEKANFSPFFFKISDDFHYSDDFSPNLMMKNANPFKNPKEICLTTFLAYPKFSPTKILI
jgi:hypothetical protein